MIGIYALVCMVMVIDGDMGMEIDVYILVDLGIVIAICIVPDRARLIGSCPVLDYDNRGMIDHLDL